MSTAVEVLSELSRRGVAIRVDGDSIRLKPRSALDDQLLASIRDCKPEILAALKSRSTPGGAKANLSGCRYDWANGYRGLRLRCVTHNHGGGSAVFRTAYGGYDTLLEMLGLGYLSGQALDDAQRTQ